MFSSFISRRIPSFRTFVIEFAIMSYTSNYIAGFQFFFQMKTIFGKESNYTNCFRSKKKSVGKSLFKINYILSMLQLNSCRMIDSQECLLVSRPSQPLCCVETR